MSTVPPRAGSPEWEAASRRAREHALDVLDWAGVTAALAELCATPAASRAANALLPDLSAGEASRSHAETAEALRLAERGLPPVAGPRDVAELVGLAAKGRVLEPEELIDVARTLDALARLVDWFGGDEGVGRCAAAPGLAGRVAGMPSRRDLVVAIEAAIDPRGAVREDATRVLAGLFRRKASLADQVEKRLDGLRRDPTVGAALTDDYVTLREGRYVLPVRAERRQALPGILHGRSGSGRSLFVEPAQVVELNNDLRAAELEIEEEVRRILAELSAAVGEAADEIRGGLAEHVAVDLAVARARLAERLDAVVPVLDEEGVLDLPSLAHPLLVLMHEPDDGAVVRNDVRLAPGSHGIVISGPNAGGKTVLLEAVGLACLMARAGLPVTAGEGARVPPCRQVLADIGDEQSLARSLSSFSGHVANLLDILAAADGGGSGPTVVLLDELMAGTDPDEGAALARALLEELAARDVRLVVTTHLGALKAFAAEGGPWRNAAMEFDAATLQSSFHVRIGVPGASAALMVAERLGLPTAVLARARELAGEDARRAEALLVQLEEARDDARRQRDAAEGERLAARRLVAEAEQRLEEARRREESAAREARTAFEAELKELREEAAALTRELQRRPSLRTATAVARRVEEIRRRAPAAPAVPKDAGAAPAEVGPGDRVRSESMGREGEVVEGPDGRGRVRVRFGRVTVQVPLDDLGEGTAAAGETPRPRRPAGRTLPEPAGGQADVGAVPFTPQGERNACDLRGLTVAEALARVSAFLEEARQAGERGVVLIHGHGTGALKRALREALPSEPRIVSFRPGGEGEGGDGVTVARLD